MATMARRTQRNRRDETIRSSMVGMRHPRHVALLGLAIALVAVNLRLGLASVGPVLNEVRTDLGLSGAQAALLTAVPVVCFGALSPSAPALARRLGIEPVLVLVLTAIAAGLLLRVVAGPSVLFTGTVIAAGAMAIANVLLPALIKRDFAERSGTMMGVYTMALSGSAAVAAGSTVPLEDFVGQGWRGALGAWAVPAVVALLAWLPFSRAHSKPPSSLRGGRSLLRDPLAWQVTVFFGLQSLCFYTMLSWLPSIYRDAGYGSAAAGFVLSGAAFVQIPVSLLLPRVATKAADQRVHAAACTLFTAAGLAGVLVAPTSAPWLWALALGIGQGGSFAIGLSLFVLRTGTSTDTARLSAMAQTVGYLIAACGPLLFGAVHDLTHSWTPALALQLLLLVPQLGSGILAGRPLCVGRPGGRH